jgi:CheY-like chemotaxis protein
MDSDRRTLRVLVVEDFPDTAETIAAILRYGGHEVRIAPDGEEALNAAQSWQPDVVLLDIGLPKVDGWEVAKRLRRRAGRHALVIAVTGYGTPDDFQRSGEAGIDLHLLKPADPELLLSMLERFRGVAYPAT